jgi:hypothetical protein
LECGGAQLSSRYRAEAALNTARSQTDHLVRALGGGVGRQGGGDDCSEAEEEETQSIYSEEESGSEVAEDASGGRKVAEVARRQLLRW